MTEAFQNIQVPQRQEKPRTRGITMMIDWGIPLSQQTDILAAQRQFIDKAKIAGGIPRVMPVDLLKAKLEAYREAEISTANGGLFTELTLKQGTYEVMLAELTDLGFDAVEVSEILLTLTPEEKTHAVKYARAQGLKVLGEVGRKEGKMSDDEIIKDVEIYLNAGCVSVYLEAAELFESDTVREDLIRRLADQFPTDALIWELPVTILPGMTKAIKHKTASRLVALLGTEVNLANVEHDEIYVMELWRRGLAGDTAHPKGAYRLAGIGEP